MSVLAFFWLQHPPEKRAGRRHFVLSMIVSENRLPFFGIMLLRKRPAQGPGVPMFAKLKSYRF